MQFSHEVCSGKTENSQVLIYADKLQFSHEVCSGRTENSQVLTYTNATQVLDDALRAFAHALKLPGPESLPPHVFYRQAILFCVCCHNL